MCAGIASATLLAASCRLWHTHLNITISGIKSLKYLDTLWCIPTIVLHSCCKDTAESTCCKDTFYGSSNDIWCCRRSKIDHFKENCLDWLTGYTIILDAKGKHLFLTSVDSSTIRLKKLVPTSSMSSLNRQGEIRLMMRPVHLVRCMRRLAAMVELGMTDGNRSIRWSTARKAVCLAIKTALRISAIFRDSDTAGLNTWLIGLIVAKFSYSFILFLCFAVAACFRKSFLCIFNSILHTLQNALFLWPSTRASHPIKRDENCVLGNRNDSITSKFEKQRSYYEVLMMEKSKILLASDLKQNKIKKKSFSTKLLWIPLFLFRFRHFIEMAEGLKWLWSSHQAHIRTCSMSRALSFERKWNQQLHRRHMGTFCFFFCSQRSS